MLAPAVKSYPTFFDFLYQIFDYREYLKQSVLRDLRTKYKRSIFGYLWTMVHPLAMMLVLAVVFSHLVRTENYAVFLLCGLLPWNYFNSTVMMSLHTLRTNSRLFGQIAMPKYIFVISLVCSNFVNYLLALVPLLLIMLIYGQPIRWTVLAFPVVVLPLICLVTAVSLVLALGNVFFDDTLHLTEVGMQALYFLSPVLYKRELLPPHLVKYLVLNPLFGQIESMRGIFYDGVLPDPSLYCLNLATSILMLYVAVAVFHRTQDRFLYFL